MKHILGIILMTLGMGPCSAQDYPVTTFTTRGGKKVKMTLINHGSIALELDGKWVQIDPVGNFYGRKIDYSAFPKADLILVTHEHGDHLDGTTIETLCKEDTRIILNAASRQQLGMGTVMANGDQMDLDGIGITAVPAYNTTPGHGQFHPQGNGNGYLIAFDGLRIYVSGDTEDIPEMALLKDIDVALLSANQPYTMTPEQCVKAAKVIRPGILIPYHLGDTDIQGILDGLKDTDIEVRVFETLR